MFKKPVSVNYPDQKFPMFPKWRGKQVLMRDENGLEKCVACGLCAVACPADAIYLEAAENDGSVQAGPRYAKVYQIHKTRCIFCGYCEEACPVDAIRLGPEYELADFARPDFVYTKDMLLDPEKYAPRRQYHADVDQKDPELTREIPEDEDLGEVYRRHRPIDAPITSPPEERHHPMA
jgi:NADH-quinone oxidoreductase subunit I